MENDLNDQKKVIEEDLNQKEDKIVKDINGKAIDEQDMTKKTIIGVYIILVIFGIGTGYFLSQTFTSSSGGKQQSKTIQTEKVVGSTDTQTFKDSAEGVIEKGGIDGEGTHKLVREGGPSQTVYLTSSVVNLDDFVGEKVTVWGETFAAQKAAWLMDVGKVERK